MRLFVGLDIEDAIRARLASFREQMKSIASEVRWVRPDTFHITLQFLGETKKVEEVKAALLQVQCAPVNISFRGTGFFPSPRAPRVFWVGIQADHVLQDLAQSVASVLKPLGFLPDRGEYKPHLTLARSGSGRPRRERGEQAAPALQRLCTKLESLAQPEFGTMTAHEFYLYESRLSSAGPSYTKLARYDLNSVVGT